MWRLSVLPSTESGLSPADVVVHARPDARVRDLARALGEHLAPAAGSTPLLAPTTDGVPWPADALVADCGLRGGDVVAVASVPTQWLERPAALRRPRAVVRVLAGPDAGLTVDVHSPALTIGRADTCTVRLTDPLVSRLHARIVLTGGPVLSDEGSAHGTLVDGREVGRPVQLRWDQPVQVGSTRLLLTRTAIGATDDEVAVLRPPRFGALLAAAELDVPAPPAKPRRQAFPWPMMLMPIVLGAGMFLTTHSRYSLVLMFAWPLMLVTGQLVQRRQQAREHAEELAAWRVEVQEVLDALDDAAQLQRARAEEDDPDPDVVRARIAAADRGTWGRKPDDPDFLALRVGRGPVAALVTGTVSRGGDRTEREEVRVELARRARLDAMPVLLPVAEHGLVSLTAPAEVLDGALRAVLLRLAATHSPHEVSLAAVLAPERAHLESWLRWLPHTARRLGGAPAVAVGASAGAALLDLLATDDGGHSHTVCVVDEGAGLPRRSIEAVAARAVERRLHLVWCGSDPDRVPAATAVLADLTAGAPVVAVARRGGLQPVSTVDALGLVPAWQAARTLSTFRDDVAVIPADTALPDSVRLPELGSDLHDLDDAGVLLERWRTSRGLRAQIGSGVDGVVTLDLREDGPHGLVAGTTGSGKSELLQTLICSLAVNNPPSRITFLLVDYKGGAAFRECAELPHSVGMITDLTPALVQRALVSLHAELTAREGLLATYGAKDLVALERDHPEVAPPSLLICVDEFAALTAEVPEFVDGMVSIAQRGRSLGMHMLLATQRPAGVVTAQIKANTDLRIALRVGSPDDSTDVIDAPDAARLSRRTPGRAWVRRTGHGTSELVQVAFVGGREVQRDGAAVVEVSPFTAVGDAAAAAAGVQVHPRSDLDRLVSTAQEAATRSGLPAPRRPWLPALAPELFLACREPGELLLGAAARDEALVPGSGGGEVAEVRPTDGQVLLGLLDSPETQSQTPLLLDLARSGHLLVFGTSGSGKTELLRTLAVSATAAAGSCPPVVYGIDCGGGGLGVLADLPSVGSVVGEQQLERVLRMIRMLHRTIAERNALLASRGAGDVAALAAAGVEVPRIHLLVDNLPGLLEALEGGGSLRRGHVDQLVSILQEGRRCGVHVSATTPHRVGVPSAMQSAFGQRMVLRMTVDDDYAMLGAPAGVLDSQSVPGRGLLGTAEVQLATTGGAGTSVQGERIRELAATVAPVYTDRPTVPVPAMPTRLPFDLLPATTGRTVNLGVDAELAGLVHLDLLESPLLVAGRARTGRTSLLLALAGQARHGDDAPEEVVVLGPRAEDVALRPEVDRALATPTAALEWLRTGRRSAGWTLLLVDDVHEWERGWEAGGEQRELLTELAAAVETARARRLAVVVVADPDEARTRTHVAGPVAAVRRGRRGLLLSPEPGDGTLLGTQVPIHTHEPVTGTGRGLLCTGGTTRVVQVVCAPQVEGASQGDRCEDERTTAADVARGAVAARRGRARHRGGRRRAPARGGRRDGCGQHLRAGLRRAHLDRGRLRRSGRADRPGHRQAAEPPPGRGQRLRPRHQPDRRQPRRHRLAHGPGDGHRPRHPARQRAALRLAGRPDQGARRRRPHGGRRPQDRRGAPGGPADHGRHRRAPLAGSPGRRGDGRRRRAVDRGRGHPRPQRPLVGRGGPLRARGGPGHQRLRARHGAGPARRRRHPVRPGRRRGRADRHPRRRRRRRPGDPGPGAGRGGLPVGRGAGDRDRLRDRRDPRRRPGRPRHDGRHGLRAARAPDGVRRRGVRAVPGGRQGRGPGPRRPPLGPRRADRGRRRPQARRRRRSHGRHHPGRGQGRRGGLGRPDHARPGARPRGPGARPRGRARAADAAAAAHCPADHHPAAAHVERAAARAGRAARLHRPAVQRVRRAHELRGGTRTPGGGGTGGGVPAGGGDGPGGGTPVVTLDAPTGVRAEVLGTGSVRVSWTPGASGADGFTVSRSGGGGGTTAGGGERSATVSGLPSGTFTFTVSATRGGATARSAPSAPVTVGAGTPVSTSSAPSPTYLPPAPPTTVAPAPVPVTTTQAPAPPPVTVAPVTTTPAPAPVTTTTTPPPAPQPVAGDPVVTYVSGYGLSGRGQLGRAPVDVALAPPGPWASWPGGCQLVYSGMITGTQDVACSATSATLPSSRAGDVTVYLQAVGGPASAPVTGTVEIDPTDPCTGVPYLAPASYQPAGLAPQLPPCQPAAYETPDQGSGGPNQVVWAFGLLGAAALVRVLRTGSVRPAPPRAARPVTLTSEPVALDEQDVAGIRLLHRQLADAVEGAVRGKRAVVELVCVAMLAGGHVLLEDVPGTGKTTLARALATAIGGRSRRIQFTPDLLPSDVTGTSVYEPATGEVRFRAGPVFSNVLLADEINRAAAKTQSALLEVMQERTVTVDGVAHAVPDPFLVVATQNPIDLDGTYRLPEAQLDRFMLKTTIGYPDAEHELDVLRPGSSAGSVEQVPAVTTPEEVARCTAQVARLHVAEEILRYVRALGAATREVPDVRLGASTRSLRSLVRCAQVHAAVAGRHYVVPSDVQRLVQPVLAHRLVLHREATVSGRSTADVLTDVLAEVAVPRPSAG